MAKTNFLEQYWNFWGNRCVDPQSDKFFVSRFARLKTFQEVNLIELYQSWYFCFVGQTPLQPCGGLGGFLYSKKRAWRTWKPSCMYVQMCGDFTSRPKSESWGPKFWKVWIGCIESWDPYFTNEKNQEVRCKKTFENWLRVPGSKISSLKCYVKNAWLHSWHDCFNLSSITKIEVFSILKLHSIISISVEQVADWVGSGLIQVVRNLLTCYNIESPWR